MHAPSSTRRILPVLLLSMVFCASLARVTAGDTPEWQEFMFELGAAGTIVAHWLQYETDQARDGQLICEADQQFFLDGDTRPTLQSMGSEDLYGGSWGFIEPKGDGQYTAVLRHETLGNAGSRIAVLRCRSRDAISFRQSCKWVLTWANDGWAADKLGDTPIPYRHCVYYYTKD